MITELTVYKTSDGTQFSTRHQAEEYEQQQAKLHTVRTMLGPDHDLATGEYWQHQLNALTAAWSVFWTVVCEHYKSETAWAGMPAHKVETGSVIGRVVTDGNGPIAAMWHRFTNIDFTTGREYQQPYYKNHPKEAPVCKNG